MHNKTTKTLLFIPFSVLIFAATSQYLTSETGKQPFVTGKGNPTHLLADYRQWEHRFKASGKTEILDVALHYSKAFSALRYSASGLAQLNLANGQIHSVIKGLDNTKTFQLVLSGYNKNEQQHTVTKNIGRLSLNSDNKLEITAKLDRLSLSDFQFSRFEIQEISAGQPPLTVLAGSPSLYQRLFYSGQPWTVAGIGTEQDHQDKYKDNLPFSFLLPESAYAAFRSQDTGRTLNDLVAQGRELFKNETFNGNGRTCATCHRLNNNHTIDPKFITSLPDDDPLFIAEQNPNLSDLENSKLLRQLGLILVNIDGFDNPPVFRGVPHTLALSTSIIPEEEFEGQQVVHALGWSADGSAGDGSLRMFTVGAILQHMTRTLDRVEGRDFRLPSDEELDALEAYMLSLGRSEDPDLDSLFFSSPIVQRGRELFHSKDIGTAQCKGCHLNGGANSSTSLQNGNRDTGVENMPENPARLIWSPTAADGGFGTEVNDDCGWDNQFSCYGNREFNMTTVIEAADTPPFFHNNSVNTIEEAIAFYNSDAFHNSPGANPADPSIPGSVCERCIHIEPTQVVSVALFLRTINAMENIRSSNALDQQASEMTGSSNRERREIIEIAISETQDAIEVLQGGALIPYPETIKLLKQALKNQRYALTQQRFSFLSRWNNRYKIFLQKSVNLKRQANDLMLTESS